MKPFLRFQSPEDPELMIIYREKTQELHALSDDQTEDFLILAGTLGALACNLDLLEDSLKYLETALEISHKTKDAQRELANRVRLAVTLQYLDRYTEADEHFQKALKATLEDELQVYRDMVLQFWGKLLAEQGKYEAAHTCFEQALFLRQAKQDPVLIEDSEDAIELLTSLGGVSDEGYAVMMTEIAEIQVP